MGILSLFFLCSNFVFSGMSAVCYRLGGSDYANTKVRDIGAPLGLILAFFPWLVPAWWVIAALFVTHFASCTPGYGGEGEPYDEQSFLYRSFQGMTFFVVGVLFGLAAVPMIWAGTPWLIIVGRALFLGVTVLMLNRHHRWLYTRMFQRWFADAAEMEEVLRWLLVVISFWLTIHPGGLAWAIVSVAGQK